MPLVYALRHAHANGGVHRFYHVGAMRGRTHPRIDYISRVDKTHGQIFAGILIAVARLSNPLPRRLAIGPHVRKITVLRHILSLCVRGFVEQCIFGKGADLVLRALGVGERDNLGGTTAAKKLWLVCLAIRLDTKKPSVARMMTKKTISHCRWRIFPKGFMHPC